MIKLGEIQTLTVARTTDNGVYLAEDEHDKGVLLPKNQVTKETKIGDKIEVFIYRDSEDRLIATTTKPKITLDKVAALDVKEVTEIGAFLDWGLLKDLFLPFKQQKNKLYAGDKVVVSLYIDKSNRLCATSKIYDILSCDSPYSKGDNIDGIVFDINSNLGAFIAVDSLYCGLIPNNEYSGNLRIGDAITARVVNIRDDGKINLSMRDTIDNQIDNDAEIIIEKLNLSDGFLPYNDKSSPDIIQKEFSISKNSFKKAIGRLYKEKKIAITNDGIKLNN